MEIHKEEIIKDFGKDNIDKSGRVLWNKIFNSGIFTDYNLEKYKDCIPWGSFIIYQPISSDVLEKYKSYIDWSLVFKYQVLSNEDILRYYNKIGLKNAIYYQHFTSEMIYYIEKKNSSLVNDVTWNNSLLSYQILSEEFILKNINRLYIPNILYTQRMTPKLKNELLDSFNKLRNYIRMCNYLYRTDIGKDWFVGYAKNYGNKLNPRYHLLDPRNELLTAKYGLLKVRVYYNSYVSKFSYREVDIIRKIGKVSSLIKRV